MYKSLNGLFYKKHAHSLIKRRSQISLQANLDEYKANFNKTAPADVQKTKHQAAEELQNSRILERVLKKGDNADDSWTLPLAARFIIDRDAVIRYAETDTDYRVRPEPEHTLKALEAL